MLSRSLALSDKNPVANERARARARARDEYAERDSYIHVTRAMHAHATYGRARSAKKQTDVTNE